MPLSPLEERILAVIAETPGLKAREIANKLGVERQQINSLLYRD